MCTGFRASRLQPPMSPRAETEYFPSLKHSHVLLADDPFYCDYRRVREGLVVGRWSDCEEDGAAVV